MFIAIDIGGTNTRIGASKDGRRLYAIEKFKTPKKFADGIKAISRTVLHATKGQSLKSIVIAVPGPIDHPRGKVLHLPNLPGWRNKPITKVLTRHLNCKVLLINDADAAGLGEARRGAGRGYTRVAYFTISTGIGGALIINDFLPLLKGEIKRGSKCPHPLTISAEPGHQILIPGGRRDNCGQRGCFEAYASGTGFYKTYGVRPENCKNKKIWAKHAQTVGWGLINTIVHWSPDIVVIGGGLAQAGTLLFTPLRAYVRKNLKIFKPPLIVPSKLGDDAGLYGCLELLKGSKNFS
ncbi:ROK family protein [Candidatus Uhrbacteria bacterium]|nr:ROK family protein [Candidatus Uhrbacteria bacterium]